MKVETKFKKGSIEILITENIEDKTSKEFLKEMIEFIKEHSDFLSSSIEEEQGLLVKTETPLTSQSMHQITSKMVQQDIEFPSDIEKISNALDIKPEELTLILITEKKVHGIYPLAPISKKGARTARQRPAVWIYLYQNYILNKERTLTAFQLTDLLNEAVIDPDELSKAIRNNPNVTLKNKIYSITAKGIKDAASAFQELINKVK